LDGLSLLLGLLPAAALLLATLAALLFLLVTLIGHSFLAAVEHSNHAWAIHVKFVRPCDLLFPQRRVYPNAGQLDQLLPSFRFLGRLSLPQAFTRVRVVQHKMNLWLS
jgi:hypothetical protein